MPVRTTHIAQLFIHQDISTYIFSSNRDAMIIQKRFIQLREVLEILDILRNYYIGQSSYVFILITGFLCSLKFWISLDLSEFISAKLGFYM